MITRLRKYRTEAKLSQGELAILVGFSDGQRRISHYENGKRRPRPDLNDCRALVKALNQAGVACTLDDVFPPDDPEQETSDK
ncbi:MAG: helix-turn-helix transcriptional regulator [Reinekea sp.]